MVELEALQANLNQFRQRGADVLALCPQKPEHNLEIVEQLGLEFPVLQDRNNEVAEQFGIVIETPAEVIAAEQTLGLDLPEHNGTDHWNLPIPSRFLIDTNGQVRSALLHVDHRMRTDPSECLMLLE